MGYRSILGPSRNTRFQTHQNFERRAGEASEAEQRGEKKAFSRALYTPQVAIAAIAVFLALVKLEQARSPSSGFAAVFLHFERILWP